MNSADIHSRRPVWRIDTTILLLGAFATGLLLGGTAPAEPVTPDFVRAAARVDPSCVGIVSRESGTARDRGAGFVLGAGGVVVTAAHVVVGAGPIAVRLANGEETPARLVGVDEVADVAVLRIDADPPAITAAPAGAVGRGDPVAAIGDPLGYAATLTVGHLSTAARPYGETSPHDLIQHDAALNPGSSGGPLIDREGRVVGMNLAIADGARRHVGIGLALPIAVVERVAGRMANEGFAPRLRLGLRLRGAEALRGAIPNLPAGVVVEAVEPRSAAARGGLAAGDLLVAADGVRLTGARDLARALEAKRVGDPLRLGVRVGDDEREVILRVGIAAANPEEPAVPETVDLGLDIAAGRIATVRPEGPAESAGLAVGDEVLAIGMRRLTGEEGSSAVRDAEATAGPGGVALLVRREEKTRWVVLGKRGRLDGDAPFGSNAEALSSHLF